MKRPPRAVSAVASTVVTVVLLAGCSQAVQGQAEPAPTTAAPTTTAPATTTAPPTTDAPSPTAEVAATPADVPALVQTVEGLFTSIADADYETACGYLDFGDLGQTPGTIAACAGGLESSFEQGLDSQGPGAKAATLEALKSITVKGELVQLAGSGATIPSAAVISTISDVNNFIPSDITARLTADGWKIDPTSLG